MKWGDIPSWVAAVAAIAAAVVVGYQAHVAARAVKDSQSALAVATESLEQSRLQSAEAVRARIDAATPTVTVVVPAEPAWPPMRPPEQLGHRPEAFLVGEAAPPMLMPRDRMTQIALRVPVTIRNESDQHVVLDLHRLRSEDNGDLPSRIELAGRGQEVRWFWVSRSLEEWTAIHRERTSGKPGAEEQATVTYSDPADTGALDWWHITMGGCPVVPTPEIEGGWRIIEEPRSTSGEAVGIGQVIRERRYYLSRRRGQVLE